MQHVAREQGGGERAGGEQRVELLQGPRRAAGSEHDFDQDLLAPFAHLSFDHGAGAGYALVTPAPVADQVGDGAEVGVDGELVPRGVVAGGLILDEIHFGDLHNPGAHKPIIEDRGLFERVQRRTVSRGRQDKSERMLARLGVLRCGTCGSRMVINSYSGNYRCGDTSTKRCQRRAAVKADRVEEIVLNAVRAYWATADAHGRASRKRQIREADEAVERANKVLDDTIRQLGELGLLGRPASQQTLKH